MASKIKLVIGTRPEAIKMIPVFMELKDQGFEVELISTGQHREMLLPIFDLFNIVPDRDLDLMKPNQTLSQFASFAFEKIEQALSEDTDLIIVQGDTITAQIAAQVAFYNKIKVAHVEAGLRTGDKYSPFPEEVNRKIISILADYHFAPTQVAVDNLASENVMENVLMTGNTVIDALLRAKEQLESEKIVEFEGRYSHVCSQGGNNILVTCHRRESFGKEMEDICEALKSLAQRYSTYQFIFPVHLNPNVREVVFKILNDVPNIHLIDPVPYPDMIYLMTQSKIIITDSGGIQEEAPALDVPVVVMRNHTERMEGVEAGCSVLVGTDKDSIQNEVCHILDNPEVFSRMANAKNPFGDGTAAVNIVNHLKKDFL